MYHACMYVFPEYFSTNSYMNIKLYLKPDMYIYLLGLHFHFYVVGILH